MSELTIQIPTWFLWLFLVLFAADVVLKVVHLRLLQQQASHRVRLQ